MQSTVKVEITDEGRFVRVVPHASLMVEDELKYPSGDFEPIKPLPPVSRDGRMMYWVVLQGMAVGIFYIDL